MKEETLMKISPNPALNEVKIKLILQDEKNLSILITDMEGKLVQSEMLNGNGLISHRIQTGKFKSGTYIFSLLREGNLLDAEKVIIQ